MIGNIEVGLVCPVWKHCIIDIAGSVGATKTAGYLEELITYTTVRAKRLIRNPHVAILREGHSHEVVDREVPRLGCVKCDDSLVVKVHVLVVEPNRE